MRCRPLATTVATLASLLAPTSAGASVQWPPGAGSAASSTGGVVVAQRSGVLIADRPGPFEAPLARSGGGWVALGPSGDAVTVWDGDGLQAT